MITCPNCGHHNRDDARYCAACRVNLGDAAPKDARGRPKYGTGDRLTLWERIKRRIRRTD